MYGGANACCMEKANVAACESFCVQHGCEMFTYWASTKRCDIMMQCIKWTPDSMAQMWAPSSFAASTTTDISDCNMAKCGDCTDGIQCSSGLYAQQDAHQNCDNSCRNPSISAATTFSDIKWPQDGTAHLTSDRFSAVGLRSGGCWCRALTMMSNDGYTDIPPVWSQCSVVSQTDDAKLVTCTRGIAEHPDGTAGDIGMVGFKISACKIPTDSSQATVCHSHRQVKCVKCQSTIYGIKEAWGAFATTPNGQHETWASYMAKFFQECGTFQSCSTTEKDLTALAVTVS